MDDTTDNQIGETMYLRGKKIIGKSISHPLSNIKAELLPDATKRLLGGDRTVIPNILSHHIPLIISIASRYAMTTAMDSHDLVSVGVIAAVEACNDLVEGDVTIYIINRVHSAIAGAIRQDKKRLMGRLDGEPIINHPFGLLETEEILDRCVKTEFERAILGFRKLGLTHLEIAANLGLSKSQVHNVLMLIGRRYNEFLQA